MGRRGKRKKLESKAFTGIALGCSDNANGLMFWTPTLQQFCVSANYKLDGDCSLANAFPHIRYDGDLNLRLWRSELTFVLQPPGRIGRLTLPDWSGSLRKDWQGTERRCSNGRSPRDQRSGPSDGLLPGMSSRKPGDGFMREDRTDGP